MMTKPVTRMYVRIYFTDVTLIILARYFFMHHQKPICDHALVCCIVTIMFLYTVHSMTHAVRWSFSRSCKRHAAVCSAEKHDTSLSMQFLV